MEKIQSYNLIETIGEEKGFISYKAKKDNDPRSFILRKFKTNNPSSLKIAKFKNEYNAIKSCEVKGIIQIYDVIIENEVYALIEEDFQGENLKSCYTKGLISIENFLKIAISLSETLGYLHKKSITHRNIKPQSILINPFTFETKLFNFGVISELTNENDRIYDMDVLTETIPYISPEQTGRMNRNIDYRTDFYSLGITFYEILTGRLPFSSFDPLELYHSHIARKCPSCTEIDQKIPNMISAIVMKLLSKTPEERYQNGFGLMYDLQECLKHYEKNKDIPPFKLALNDISIKFNIPQKIFGREKEIGCIMYSFDQICKGEKETIFVSGPPGIGKSAIINEIHKPIITKKGYFISGKYDLFKQNIPYSGIIQAFTSLIKQILCENTERIASYKNELLNALGPNGKVISDVIPDIELIIGKQAPVVKLPPEESRKRFIFVFENFIKVFTSKEYPLVLFLDDLQWIDTASIQLIEKLIKDTNIKYLLFIGSYRSINCEGPELLKESIKLKTKIINISVQPLSITNINNFISDFLKCDPEKSHPLSLLVHKKTEGNPFFVNQFLKTLYDKHYLEYDSELKWKWDIERIQRMKVTDNVLDLMADKIKRQKENTQEILKICSCIGNIFDIDTLSIILNKSVDETLNDLNEAIEEGLIARSRDSFVFHHDRIQEAAYSIIQESRKKELHYKIGNLLLHKTSKEHLKEKIFNIVNQLNLCTNIITAQEEQIQLAELNLLAGQKAKESTAYQESGNFLNKGISFLPKDCWSKHYNLTISLHIETGEIEYILLNFNKAEKLLNVVLENAVSVLEKIRVLEIKVSFYTTTHKIKEAIKSGKMALRMLGYKLPNGNIFSILKELLLAKILLKNKNIENLINLPAVTDLKKLAHLKILTLMLPTAYLCDYKLVMLIALRSLTFTLRNGNSIYSSLAYVSYGIAISGKFGLIEQGYKFGQLAIKVNEKYNAKELQPRIYFIYADMISYLKNHINDSLPLLLKANKTGLEVGDLIYGAFGMVHYLFYFFFSGKNLLSVENEYKKFEENSHRYSQQHSMQVYKLGYQLVFNLRNDIYSITGNIFNEDKNVSAWVEAKNFSVLAFYFLAKEILSFFNEDYKTSIQASKEAKKYIMNVANMFFFQEHYFYSSLSILNKFSENGGSDLSCLKEVRTNQKILSRYADSCPKNFFHKYCLIEAKLAEIKNENLKAAELYNKAVKNAKQNGFLQDEAIANELAAHFWLKKSNRRIASNYMINAFNCYSLWGAEHKIKTIYNNYQDLLNETLLADSNTSKADVEQIGLTTLSKSLMTIAEEKIHSRMIEKIITIAIEFAGAQKGVLILKKNNEEYKNIEDSLFIEAEGMVDSEKVDILKSMPVEKSTSICQTIVNYVARTKESVVLHDARIHEEKFPQLSTSSYIKDNNVKSILCMPILIESEIIPQLAGILYLENNLATHTFTENRIETLEIICLSAAGRIELSQKAVTDGLTNIYNHEYFQNILKKEILISERQNHNLSLIMIDIDNFKNFNDTFGHQTGDTVLQKVAQAIKNTCRASDIISRYGGEEFSVVLRETIAVDAAKVAEKIRKSIENLRIDVPGTNHKNIKLTISSGVSSFPSNAKSGRDIIKKADEALYVSKKSGKNKVTLAN